MSDPRRFTTVLLCAILSAASLHAQSDQPLHLSLSDAVRRAISEGTTAKLASTAEQRARINEREALSGLLPQADARIIRANQSINLETFGFVIPGQPPVIGPFNVTEGQISAAAQLFNMTALRLWQSRHAGVAASHYETIRAENDVITAVARIYVMLQRADAQVATRRADAKLFEELLRVANDEFQVGTGTRLDVAQAKLQLSRAHAAVLAAENDRNSTALALLNAIGEEDAKDVVVDPLDANPPAAQQAPTADALLAAAAANRPDIQALEAHRREADLAYSAAKAQYLPKVQLDFDGDYGGLHTDNLHWARAIRGVVSMPLFRGTIPANVARARLEAEDVETRLSSAKRDVEQDVRTSVMTLQNAQERVKVAEEGVQVAEEALTIARDRRSAGYGSPVEVDRAEDQYQQAHEALISARADAALASVLLRRATGDIHSLAGESQ